MKRKFCAFLLVLTFLLACVPGAAAEETSTAPTITVGSLTVDPGQEFTVPVTVSNSPGIISMVLDISWPDTLSLVEVKDTGLYSNGIVGDTSASPCTLSWIMTAASEDDYDNGDIALLTFRVKETAAAGSYGISVGYNAENVFDRNLDNMPFTTVDGQIKVTGTAQQETTAPSVPETTAPAETTAPTTPETTAPSGGNTGSGGTSGGNSGNTGSNGTGSNRPIGGGSGTDATEPTGSTAPTKPEKTEEPKPETKPTEEETKTTEPEAEETKTTEPEAEETIPTTVPGENEDPGGSNKKGPGILLWVVLIVAILAILAILILLFIKNPRRFRRITCFLLVVTLTAGLLPLTAAAEDGELPATEASVQAEASEAEQPEADSDPFSIGEPVQPETGDGEEPPKAPETARRSAKYSAADAPLTLDVPASFSSIAPVQYTFTPDATGFYCFTVTRTEGYDLSLDSSLSISVDGMAPIRNDGSVHVKSVVYYLEGGNAYTVQASSQAAVEEGYDLAVTKPVELEISADGAQKENTVSLRPEESRYGVFIPTEEYFAIGRTDYSYSVNVIINGTDGTQYDVTGQYSVDAVRRDVYQLKAGQPCLVSMISSYQGNTEARMILEGARKAASIKLNPIAAYTEESCFVSPYANFMVEPADAFVKLSFTLDNSAGTQMAEGRPFGGGYMFEMGSVAGTGKLTITDAVSGLSSTVDVVIKERPVARDMYLENTEITCYIGGNPERIRVRFGPEQAKEDVIFSIKEDDDPDNDDLVTLEYVCGVGVINKQSVEIILTGGKTGTVTVVAESAQTHLIAECVVHVENLPTDVQEIVLPDKVITQIKGTEASQWFEVKPDGIHNYIEGGLTFQVESDNPDVVSIVDPVISGTGFEYQCKAVGQANITVSTTTSSGGRVEASFLINVQEEIPAQRLDLTIAGVTPKEDEKGTYYPIPDKGVFLLQCSPYPADANEKWEASFTERDVIWGGHGLSNENGVIDSWEYWAGTTGESTLTVTGKETSSSIRVKIVGAETLEESRSYVAELSAYESSGYNFTPAESGHYVFFSSSAKGRLDMTIQDGRGRIVSTENSTGGEYGCGAYLEADITYRLVCRNDTKFYTSAFLTVRKAKVPTRVSIVATNGSNLLGQEEIFRPAFDSVEHFGPVNWQIQSGAGLVGGVTMNRYYARMTLRSSGILEITATLPDTGASDSHSVYIKSDPELDVDNDGSAFPTAGDVDAVRYYVTGDASRANEALVDVNGDGEANAKDAVILARYIEGN